MVPGAVDQVVIAPNSVDIGMEMTQQFVAVGADQFGNRISGLTFAWSVEAGGGTINNQGLFTAGTEPDSYNKTVKAEALQGGTTRSGSATVTVEPDRIAFVSDRSGDGNDVYIMNSDGTNVERLTHWQDFDGRIPSWSPDGRRIVSDVCFIDFCQVTTVTDDGSWVNRLSGEDGFWPSWSPDGDRVAFVTSRNGNWEIYVMDIDGGRQTRVTGGSEVQIAFPTWSPDGSQIAFAVVFDDGDVEIFTMNSSGRGELNNLTEHTAFDSVPSWSPDGKEIAFASDRDGDFEIYVMDSDGSNVDKLTSNGVFDSHPSWSLDGSQILFNSLRDDPDSDDIYIMNRNGTDVRRLTSNSAVDTSARWAPRKSGLEVSAASVVISDASSLRARTVQEVTASARGAVVRIETDVASGSGFVVDAGGLILTNNHVILNATRITVYLEDGTSYEGAVFGRDLVRDMAVVKIEAGDLPTLKLADLGKISLGQPVLVLGYPLGKDRLSVTSGLVSAIDFDGGRNIRWVQTDSAINPGNSGGPLLNLQGEVIGIVTEKQSDAENIGFAASANSINLYLERLMDGEVIGGAFRNVNPDWSPTADKIAFQSDRHGNWESYTMNADGSSVTRLTFNAGGDDQPAWSPDGTKLAFVSDRDDPDSADIYVMNADGSDVARLTSDPAIDYLPAWSPDGSKILFVARRDGNSEIYVMDVNGTNQVRLTHEAAVDQWPAWSPDGSKIVYQSIRDGNWEIYVMNPDGSGETRLTDDPAIDRVPAWTPDGRISYTAQRDGNQEIYVMNADGTDQTRLTSTPSEEFGMSWSPDGSKLTYTSNGRGVDEVYVMNADGSGQTRIQ